MRLHLQQAADARRYNLPTVEEIAAVVPGDGSENVRAHRDIILRLQGGGLRRISNLHPSYLPLHYVLFFPHGEEGWHLDIPLQLPNGNAPHRSKKVTQLLWYAYRLHIRPSEIEPQNLFKGGRLFQQFTCDGWASIEQCNLTWAANNQKKLRADLYQGLQDRMRRDGDEGQNLAQVGHVILPFTHKSGPRYMQQLLQDSLAICREFRKPDLFLTMTANGSWPEISQNLLPGMYINTDMLTKLNVFCHLGQTTVDRPDLVARVFHAKQQTLLKKIRDGYFGEVAGFVYTIEYQKRGLPHMHLLIFLEQQHKISTVQQIDAIISAQIPDSQIHPQLHAAVSKYMLHGPCSPQRCLENNVCKKCFPKAFMNQTIIKEDGYPDYACPDNGRTVQKHQDVFDNKVVVPHPRELLVQFNCHINLEVCASIKAVKYIHKYIYKGPDRATVLTEGENEIRTYLDARYISSTQACHNIFKFPMHMEWPAVHRLAVHLPGRQSMVFQAKDEIENVLNNVKDTQLLGWFKANQDPDLIEAGAHNHLYQDFPKKFVWNKSRAVWMV